MPAKGLGRQMKLFTITVLLAMAASLTGCDERRKSDAELGLNPQQISGRRVFDGYCDRCHDAYSSGGKQGPGLKGLFQRQYMSLSGLPATDERVGEITRYGRTKMPGFSQALTDQQIADLLAYLHSL